LSRELQLDSACEKARQRGPLPAREPNCRVVEDPRKNTVSFLTKYAVRPIYFPIRPWRPGDNGHEFRTERRTIPAHAEAPTSTVKLSSGLQLLVPFRMTSASGGPLWTWLHLSGVLNFKPDRRSGRRGTGAIERNFTVCSTASRLICWRTAMTSGRFGNCWGTRTSRRP